MPKRPVNPPRQSLPATFDRHANTSGNGHIDPVGKGHTTGDTEGGSALSIVNKKFSVVHKDYVLDYASPLYDVIMKTERGAGGLTYRYVHSLRKDEAVIYGITNGVGDMAQPYAYPVGAVSVVKLYYHQDRLGTTDFMTDNVDGKATSYVSYDDWGALASKAVLKVGVRELDLVQNYTGHPAKNGWFKEMYSTTFNF